MPKTCPEGKELNPRTNNCVKICGPNQVRNLQTGRCVKGQEDARADSPVSTKISCPEGKELNPLTNKCVKVCEEGKERNPTTGRCIKSTGKTAKREVPISKYTFNNQVELVSEPKPPASTRKLTPILCPEGKEVNPKTRKCINKCKPGQVRNPETGRCIKSMKIRTPTPEPAKVRTPAPEPAKVRTPTPEPSNKKGRAAKTRKADMATPAYMIFHSKSALLDADNKYGLPADAMRRLSNFSMKDSVEYKGHVYPSAEHAYQAQKYAFAERQDLVKLFYDDKKYKTAAEAKSAGGKGGMAKNGVSMTAEQLEKFKDANDSIMQAIVESKVKRNPEIRDILRILRQHNIRLIHHSRTDMVWGAHMKPDASGILRGQNKLGEFYNELKL